jgi:arylsulfatase
MAEHRVGGDRPGLRRGARWLWLSTAVAASLAIGAPAHAQSARSALPAPPAPFAGVIKPTLAESTPSPGFGTPLQAPRGAPNLFLFMADDVGFSMSSAFGGPVPTPNMERLAESGQRYNRFHTTGICSPSRAALLTGRNHHNVGVGYLTDSPSDFPGYNSRIPPSAATVAQTLRLNGYNTAMFGKHHNVPAGEDTAAGPFDMWPTGLGFEYFFGFVSADSDQWNPNLVRGVSRVPPQDGPPTLVEQRLADDAVSWLHNQNAAAPDKPFFIYYAPGSEHAPHQAPPEMIARFKGKFDQGWDKVREETFQRQLAQGIIPAGTRLTPRPAGIPAWSSLSPARRAYATRSMEVAAAMLAYQDEQLGRVLDEMARMGELDHTLVVILQGDNGASGDSGPDGTLNEVGAAANRIQEDEGWMAANVDRLGGEHTYENYPAAWAWAMNAPLRWTKQYASMLGGVRNGMILSWPGHVARPNSVCAEFGHLVDIAPTLLEAAAVPAPDTVYGVKQKAMDGRSLLPSLAACQPDRPRTQYFEMAGKAGLYQDGWFASLDDGRRPWEQALGPDAAAPQWTLYDLRKDFSQATDVSAQNPERLQAMVQLWTQEAARNNVFPLINTFGAGRGIPKAKRNQFDFWGSDVSVPTNQVMLAGRSYTLDAELKLPGASASGVVVALGSRFGGWSLYLDEGRPSFVYAMSTRPDDILKITATERLPAGSASLAMRFNAEGVGKAARVEISSGGRVIASGRVPSTFLTPAGLGETMDVGRDLGVPVTEYRTKGGKIEGDVRHVSLRLDH